MKTLGVLAFALGLCAWGCANLPADQALAAPSHAEVYQRATNEFAEADFFKPAEPKTNDLASSLAPLVLQEVNGGQRPPSRPDRFGTLSLSNGVLVLDRSRPAIYWQADSVQLQRKPHTRFSYLWCYAVAAADQETGRAGLPLQGIRVTLNSAGAPGKPLPRRRYTIERSLEEAPNVIVARIIDDGPVAMGPIVYLTAGTRAVSTLICRCMPAQAKRLRDTSVYDLLPFQAAASQPLLTQARTLARGQTAFWPGDLPDGPSLEKRLRLPAGF